MKLGKRILVVAMAAALSLACVPAAFAVKQTKADAFTDVTAYSYYYDGVNYLAENGYMQGTTSTTFAPGATVTRGMVAAVLYRMSGSQSGAFKGTFSDVSSGLYYSQAAEWAAANGLASGYADGTFAPGQAVTRQQLAAFLYRYASYLKLDVTAQADLKSYTDSASVGSYAKTAVAWCLANGILKGANNTLTPQASATRGQLAAILYRFHELATKPATQTVAVASTSRTGVKIPAYVTLPDGYTASKTYPLVILCHGHGGNHNEWGGFDKITNGLAKDGIVAVTLDYPGCGASTEDFTLNTLTNMKADTLDVINYMLSNYAVSKSNVGIFGYSMGGRITLELLAEKAFNFAAVELVAPAEDTADLKNLFGGAAAWETMKATAQKNGYCEFTTIYGQKQKLSAQWFSDLEKYSDGLVEAAAKNYTGRSMVVYATNDEAVSPSVSAGVAAALGSAVVNTYADGHSYSFYGSDGYTVSTVNESCTDFFRDELVTRASGITGYVGSIEKYGNLDLTIPVSALSAAGYQYGDVVNVTIDGTAYEMPYCTAYSDVDQGSMLLRSSGDKLIVAINMGDFATTNGIATKKTLEDKSIQWYYTPAADLPVSVSISMKTQGGYKAQYLLHQLSYTNVRSDYASLTDAQFANFREITTTGMGDNVLYRSSSPVNPAIGRSTYADAAVKSAGIQTVVNLSDDTTSMKAYAGYADTYYSTLNVVPLNMGVDFTAADFQSKLADGLRYMTSHKGPYLIHCDEGKDRAGFVSAVLEAYMGASAKEVVSDYMVTFYNYYGVKPDTEQYTTIAGSNIVKSLQTAFGVKDLYASGVNLQTEAKEYLTSIGLSASELTALSTCLSGK